MGFVPLLRVAGGVSVGGMGLLAVGQREKGAPNPPRPSPWGGGGENGAQK